MAVLRESAGRVATNELLAIALPPGNAGANTAADHLSVLADAIAQTPAARPSADVRRSLCSALGDITTLLEL